MAKLFLAIGSFSAALCVVLGAFGAHTLKARIAAESLSTFQTGVQYHFYHSLGLILCGLLMAQFRAPDGMLKYAGLFMMVGVVLFCGSLYMLSISPWRWLGPITPLGGLAFILAWVMLGIGILRSV